MFKQKIILFTFLLFVCLSFRSFAQIVATPSAGCAPETVNFTGPAGATNVSLNFGDATPPVVVIPASHNYLNPGNYVATFTAIVGGLPVTYTTAVKISAKPTASFSFNTPLIKCAPLSATFTNASTSPTTITGYQWSFGNGAASSATNPVYSYPGSGSFTVNLTVSDANGCSNSFTAGPINVSNPPNVIIGTNPNPPSGCTAPFTPTFSGANCTSGSPIGNSLTYNWSFPGGAPGSSASQNPGGVTYNSTGVYNVTLTVTDNNNCSASAVTYVTVQQPSFSSTVPSTVCPNATFSLNVQSNQAATIWNMGNGNTFAVPTATTPLTTFTYAYGSPGTYTIQTSAGNFPCTVVQTKTIVVESVTAAITATPPSFSCGSPFVCNYFNASSPNATSYSWSATNCNGLNFSSNLANPTFSFTQGSLNPYTIFPYCIPVINLTVSTVNGCTNVATFQADTLRKPTAWFNKNKKEGCVPLTVTFRDSSFAHLAPQSIVGYTWNNGAQPPVIVGGPPPTFTTTTFTYTTTGTFTPYLIIQTAQGCIDTSFIDTVTVVTPAPLSFSFSPNEVCPGQTVQIINTSPNQNQIQHWHVTSDNGFFSGCVSNPNPGWVFTHIGTHSFTLSAWKNSCMSSTTIPQTVQVRGPIVKSRFQTNCINRKTVFFDTHIQDVANGTINFGDASPPVNFPGVLGASAQHTINHTYANTGDYTVVVTATNGITGTCTPQTFTMLVQVRDVQADIALSPTVCSSNNAVFSAASSTDVLVGCPNIGYTWFFDNAPPVVTSLTAVSYQWPSAGIHTVVLMVKDLNSCSDTVIRTIRVSSASPTFAAIPSNTICLSTGTIQFNNNTLQTPDPITNCNWSFGNGTFSTGVSTTLNPIGYFLPPVPPPSSTYAVILTATNALGCIASNSMVVQVNNPSAQLSASPNNFICVNQTVSINAPAGYLTYSLNFGNGAPASVTSNSSTVYSYTAPGIYTASITITDAFGCVNSSTMLVDVQSYPVANFSIISQGAQQPNIACLGNNISFSSTATSSPTYNLTYNWNLGNGANILAIPEVVATYSSTGVFPVTHTVSTPNGCKSVITKTVGVYGASANLNVDKTTICLGQSINFNIKSDSSTVYAWSWDFADGTPSSTLLANPPPTPTINHVYTNYPLPNGSATVSLIYYSAQFACKYYAYYPIQIIKVNADFKRNNEIALLDSVHCIGLTDNFSSLSPDPGNSTFAWDFGNGNISNLQNPSYTYSVPGVYVVTLTVTDNINNCIGGVAKNMTVNPLPTASITVRDTCQNSIFPLIGSVVANAISYTWAPSSGVTNPNALITTATASNSTSYTLTVTDVNGCVGSTVQNVYIQLPPKSVQWDTTIIIGQNVNIIGEAGSNLSYTWMPPLDLSCQFCANPVSTSTNNITYSVTVADNMGCFATVNTYTIRVDPKGSVDVPTAFTPNGDGTNDVIYVDGWGIKKLNYFRIYNRWGQLLFESNDIKNGWNGIFNGVPQNMDTYVYQVSVETFVDKEPILKTGSFKLIR